MPNVLFQMLLRASNAVGYKNYPDNVIREFVEKSAQAGIDVFRIFDSLNWVKAWKSLLMLFVRLEKLQKQRFVIQEIFMTQLVQNMILNYYKNIAKELEQSGAHILAIKDMAGLLKPEAAYR